MTGIFISFFADNSFTVSYIYSYSSLLGPPFYSIQSEHQGIRTKMVGLPTRGLVHYKLQMVVHGFLESNRERKRGGGWLGFCRRRATGVVPPLVSSFILGDGVTGPLLCPPLHTPSTPTTADLLSYPAV